MVYTDTISVISRGVSHSASPALKKQHADAGTPVIDTFTVNSTMMKGEPVMSSVPAMFQAAGISMEAALAVLDTKPFVQADWVYDAGRMPIHGTPLRGDDGTIYISVGRTLTAVQDGKKLWEIESSGQGSCLGPDGTLYTQTKDQRISAIKDGRTLWECEIGHGISSVPCLGPDGVVYVGGKDHKLHAVKDGRELWNYQAQSFIESTPCAGPDGTVYFGSFDKKIYAVKDGKKLWDYDTGCSNITRPSLGADGTLYAGINGALIAVKNGKKLWDFSTGISSPTAPLVGPDGTVYAGTKGSMDNGIYAVKDGKKQWFYKTEDSLPAPVAFDPFGNVIASSGGGTVFAVAGGRKVWDFQTGGYSECSPCAGPDGTIYVTSVENIQGYNIHTLSALSFKSMKESFQMKLEGVMESPGQDKEVLMEENEWLIIDDVRLRKRMGMCHAEGYR